MNQFITLLLFALLITPASQAQTFIFTAIPDNDETKLIQRFGKIADYLADRLNIKVKYIPVKSYPAAVTAFRHNQVQLAWFGGFTGVQARRLTPGASAIAQGREDTQFKSYFIAHTSANLTTTETLPEALQGKTIIFGSKSSTSGRLMPEFYLRQQFQAAPEQIFSRVGYSGNHSRTIALVQSGAYQIGAVNYQVWEQELADGKIDLTKVNIFWTTPEHPDYHWTIRGDLDTKWGNGFTTRLRQVLLAINGYVTIKC
tara:strand:+ start:47 stop:817 length:771 start_codon:yes stop_codon:yes gene_type:complete